MRIMLFCFFMMFGLLGCSHVGSSQYIESKNWAGLAQYDLEAGQQPRTLEDLKALGAVTEADQKEYLMRYDEYLKTFCEPKNAYKQALLGKPKNYACINDTPTGQAYENNWDLVESRDD